MRRAAPILAALLLAACGGTPRAAPDGPEAAECRAEARNSPAVRDLAQQQNFANRTLTDRLAQLSAEAESRAFNDCLRRRGLSRGGGVQAVRPPGVAF